MTIQTTFNGFKKTGAFQRRIFVGLTLCVTGFSAALTSQAKDTDVSYVEHAVSAGMIQVFTQINADTWTLGNLRPRPHSPDETLKEISRDAERVCLRTLGFERGEMEINLTSNTIFIGCTGRSQQTEIGQIRAFRNDFFQNKTVGFGRPPIAQATDTTVKHITYMDWSGSRGEWKQAGSRNWVQNGSKLFREVYRDETSVYLIADNAPSERFQIDISAKAVFHSKRVGTQPRKLLTIIDYQNGSVWGAQ